MIELKSITVKNFLSFGNVTQALKLSDSGLTLVMGANNDSNNGSDKNGAGKSSALQAVSYALYGQPLTKIKVDNLVNNINNKGMMVCLEFEKDGTKYRIERGRKPNVLKFYENNNQIYDDNAKGENVETQLDISGIIGMSHNMFKHIVALNTFADPFLKMKVADQRELIEELLGVTQLSSRSEILKKLVSVTKDNIKTEDATIKATIDANNRIKNTINDVGKKSLAWSNTNNQKIMALEEDLRLMNNFNLENELKKFDELELWSSANKTIKDEIDIFNKELGLNHNILDKLIQEMYKLHDEIQGKSNEQTISRVEQEIIRKEALIDHHTNECVIISAKLQEKQDELDTPDDLNCKTCGQILSGTDHYDYVLKRITEDRDAYKFQLNKNTDLITVLKAELENLKKDKEDFINSSTENKKKAESRYEEVNKEIDNIKLSISDIEDKLLNLNMQYKELVKPDVVLENKDQVYEMIMAKESTSTELNNERNKENPFVAQIDTLSSTLQSISYDKIDEYNELLKHQEFLLRLLTNKDSFIRKKIIEQNLSYLNVRLNHYLDKLGLPHEVVFQSDLSVEITQLGRDYDFAQLSRGEMNRVILSTSWAFRDVWESLNHGINLMWIDELLDSGISGSGAEAALGILKAMVRDRQKNVFLISHREELAGRIDHTMLITKENGFSTIEIT